MTLLRAVSLVAILGFGCGNKKTPPPPVTDAETTRTPDIETPDIESTQTPARADTGWDVQEGEMIVRVLEPGAAPRQALRFAPSADEVGEVRMTIHTGMAMSMSGMQMPSMQIPPMIVDMRLVVDNVTASEIAYSSEVTNATVREEPGVDPMLISGMKESLAGVAGMNGQVRISPRGILLDSSFEAPNADPAMAQQIDQINQYADSLSYPLPEEPVGVGAVWEVIKKNTVSGFPVAERTVITLVSRDGDALTLDSQIEQRLDGEVSNIPNLPPNTEVDITRFESSGAGKNVTNLRQVLPVSGNAEVDLIMAFNILAEGNLVEMATEVSVKTDLERR